MDEKFMSLKEPLQKWGYCKMTTVSTLKGGGLKVETIVRKKKKSLFRCHL